MLMMFHMFVWWFKILKLQQVLVSLALKQRLFGKHNPGPYLIMEWGQDHTVNNISGDT